MKIKEQETKMTMIRERDRRDESEYKIYVFKEIMRMKRIMRIQRE